MAGLSSIESRVSEFRNYVSNGTLSSIGQDPKWVSEHAKYASSEWERTPRTSMTPEQDTEYVKYMANTQIVQQEAKDNPKVPVERIIEVMTNNSNYDYVGAFLGGVKPQVSPHDGLEHFDSSVNGRMLKDPTHPTAWKEYFMKEHGHDPDSLGVGNYEDAVRWSKVNRR